MSWNKLLSPLPIKQPTLNKKSLQSENAYYQDLKVLVVCVLLCRDLLRFILILNENQIANWKLAVSCSKHSVEVADRNWCGSKSMKLSFCPVSVMLLKIGQNFWGFVGDIIRLIVEQICLLSKSPSDGQFLNACFLSSHHIKLGISDDDDLLRG